MSLIKFMVFKELRRLDKDWDLFLISADIPRDPKGYLPLPTGETTFRSAGSRMEEAVGKGKEIEESSSQQPVPRKRGRLRLIKKLEEAQSPNEPCTQYVAEKLLMLVVRLETVQGSSRGISKTWRRSGT
jgi:hypothetical protein